MASNTLPQSEYEELVVLQALDAVNVILRTGRCHWKKNESILPCHMNVGAERLGKIKWRQAWTPNFVKSGNVKWCYNNVEELHLIPFREVMFDGDHMWKKGYKWKGRSLPAYQSGMRLYKMVKSWFIIKWSANL